MRGVNLRSVFVSASLIVGSMILSSSLAHAADETKSTGAECNDALKSTNSKSKKAPAAKTVKSVPAVPLAERSEAYRRKLESSTKESLTYSLADFFKDGEDNLAIAHPFTIANAAEKTYAILTYEKPRKAMDPLYGIKPIRIYPVLTGHPLANNRMVVGNEEALDNLVEFVGSLARGDNSGKAPGFPGPAGTGKSEMLYVIDALERNLEKSDPMFKQYSYRWKDLHNIPVLRNMFRFDKEGNPNYAWIDPDMPRSPFTLLRADMQQEVLAKVLPEVRKKWKMTISKGWGKPEPKSKAIIRAILEYTYPEIADGSIEMDELTPEEYMNAISKFVSIVPKSVVQNKTEPQIIRAQSQDPNLDALFAKPNLLRQAFYANGEFKDLGVDYNGQIFQQDGGLLMFDELYRNSEVLLNLLLEVKQNNMVQTDNGEPVELDVVSIWNSNDESIEKAKEDMALKASLDRDEPHAMRLLLDPEQIEATSLFQVQLKSFKQRAYSETALKGLNFSEVYPAPDAAGKTQTAYGRYALYYDTEGARILISPLALNYMSWLASASRYETDRSKMDRYAGELNRVQRDPSLFSHPITRLQIVLGEREISNADRNELYKISHLLEEGRNGISSRDIQAWFKIAISMAIREGRGVLTPATMDAAFESGLLGGKIKPRDGNMRAYWQSLRALVKFQILLPKLAKDVRMIISGDGDKANRLYDQVESEFIELAENAGATHVVPDDGSQPMVINHTRLNRIKEAYRKKNGREFSANFLLRNIRGAVKGQRRRDPQLLEAVRQFLADEDSQTSDLIDAYNAFYRNESSDPAMVERVGHTESRLQQYGYDSASFQEAVSYVTQLRDQKIASEQQQKQ